MNYPNYLKTLLLQSVDELSASPQDFAVDPTRDFTRNRKLNFNDTMLMMLTMTDDSIQEELYTFFGKNGNAPTTTAFCKQRQKLSDKAFPTLFRLFNDKLPVSLYKGKYRLMACDGSNAEIFYNPNDPSTFFNSTRVSGRGINIIHINAMYSILDKRVEDLIVQPGHQMNEPAAFCSMVDNAECSGPAIYIGDRNYASFNNFAHVIENGQYFVLRAKDTLLKSILGRSLEGLCEMDRHIDLILSRSNAVKNWTDPAPGTRYKKLSFGSPFDYINENHPSYRMSLRVIRFEIQDGAFETIITNLPDHEFDFEDFRQLYSLRWNQETAFRDLKYRLCLTMFHSKKYRHIVHEIWARAILYNFSTAIIRSVSIEKKDTVHQYQVNYSEAFKTCRDFLRSCITAPIMDVVGLIARHTEAIRPGRSFARQHRDRHPFSFWYR